MVHPTRTRRLLVRLTEDEYRQLRYASTRRGHPMGRILRDAFAAQSGPDDRGPILATLVAVEEVRLLFLQLFQHRAKEVGEGVRADALDAALIRLDELRSELGSRM